MPHLLAIANIYIYIYIYIYICIYIYSDIYTWYTALLSRSMYSINRFRHLQYINID